MKTLIAEDEALQNNRAASSSSSDALDALQQAPGQPLTRVLVRDQGKIIPLQVLGPAGGAPLHVRPGFDHGAR